jgi:hypothetical protein
MAKLPRISGKELCKIGLLKEILTQLKISREYFEELL